MASTSYADDPTLYLYTSLTAGSSHIITATSRLETILKANKIPFRALDCATDEKARMIWGRRSRGRKLPGLVKFGSVIGDLDQIEEWNEYGELKDQLNAAEDFSSIPTSSNLSVDPNPSSAPRSGPPSRASSEHRHISISDPKDEKKEPAPTLDSNPASTLNKSAESPLTMAMRQAGAEAAAKAGIKKISTAPTTTSNPPSSEQAAAAPTSDPDTSEMTPTPATTKLSAAAAEPAASTEITAGKTPAQLAFQGAKRTSIDKIDSTSSSPPQESTKPTSPIAMTTSADTPATSAEQQNLEALRSNSITKTKSRLSEATPVAESETVLQEEETADPAVDVEKAKENVEAEETTESESKQDNPAEETGESTGISATDKAEADVTKGTKPQEGDAKDVDAVGVSVGD